VRSPPAFTVVLLAAAGLLTACGSSTHPTGNLTRSTSTATGTHTSASPRATGASSGATKQQAIAFASAVNLTRSDLPGFRVKPSEHEKETPAEKQLEREMIRCAGGFAEKKHSAVAEVESPSFEADRSGLEQSISSQVTVARTAALAVKELAAFQNAHARSCISHYLGLSLKGEMRPGETIGPLSIRAGTPPAPGTTGSFGWRIQTAITVRSLTIPLYIDILGFVDGQAEVGLFGTGFGAAVPAATEERLFSLLLARAKSHPL
jgi:hypothetical protein